MSIVKHPEELFQRRRFLTRAGGVGLAAAAAMILPTKGMAASTTPASDDMLDNTSGDTAAEILTAALIAEDLATTFYYNGLRGPVIQDPALAGPGGSAKNPSPTTGNPGNVQYLQAALAEEAQHATTLRAKLTNKSWTNDPVQTFYLPTGCFDTLSAFTGVLDALENAFIGAYLAAIIEFAEMATDSRANDIRQVNPLGGYYGARQLQWFSQFSASIMGIECEHRVLGRVISNSNPANQFNFEQTDGIATVYNGSASAVAALTPFLAPGSGLTGYSLHTAIAAVHNDGIATTGIYPPMPPARSDFQ
jgi:hypothetical protein